MKRTIPSLGLLLLFSVIIMAGCRKHTDTVNDKIKIGVILSLSGNGAATGDYTLKGIQLAVKEQNAKGGLLTRQIELDIQDSKGVGATGLELVKQMTAQSLMPFMVCTNTSDVSLNVKTETEARGITLMGSAATDKLMESANYVVRNYIESGQISDDVLTYLTETLHLSSTAVFYANNQYGNSVNNKVAEKAGMYDIDLAFDAAYDPTSLDYATTIAAENINTVPAIYVIGLGKSLGTFIKQLRDAGYTGLIIGDPLFNNPDTKTAAGTAATGVRYLDFDFDKTDTSPNVKTFVDAYTAEFKAAPENLAAITYDAMKLWFAAIEKTGSLDHKTVLIQAQKGKYNGVTGEIHLQGGNIIYPTVFKVQE